MSTEPHLRGRRGDQREADDLDQDDGIGRWVFRLILAVVAIVAFAVMLTRLKDASTIEHVTGGVLAGFVFLGALIWYFGLRPPRGCPRPHADDVSTK